MPDSKATLFVADLHLTGERPQLTELFLAFLDGPARRARALYVLGDLFEAWLGDDLILPGYQAVLDGLRELSDGGVALYVMHGNRDFLLGRDFAATTGCTLLRDPHPLQLGDGRPTLLMHGDTLCTDDLAYQSLRRTLRDPKWIGDFLARPPSVRIALARDLREQSREAVGSKDYGIMDVNQDAVAGIMDEHEVSRLIHGHTHRPGMHRFKLGRRKVERCVLADWSERQGGALVCDANGCRLEPFAG